MDTGLSWLKQKMPEATEADKTLFLETVSANRRYHVNMETSRISALRLLINYKSTMKQGDL
jgi:hypothetical protein